MLRPLWQLLLKLKSDNDINLTCDECFSILEFFIEAVGGDSTGLDSKKTDQLYQIAQTHLNRCPNCKKHHLARIKELEAVLGQAQTDVD